MKKSLFLFLIFMFVGALSLWAQLDTVHHEKRSTFNRIYEVVKEFSRVDTHYIEPQHYNFTVMLQNTNTYEMYWLRSRQGTTMRLSPKPSIKIGPYIGWRWVFLGYTIDLSHLSDGNNRKEFDLSLYSNQIGIDLFYRKTGDDYRISELEVGSGIDTSPLDKASFDGFKASVKGFNLYYIFNHKRFSYPAAFSQSTCQKISTGSPLVGIGYTHHSLDLDWCKLYDLAEERLNSAVVETIKADTSLLASKINYSDFSVMGGYAYNWVFAKNWLFAASLSLALGYQSSKGDEAHKSFSFRNFTFKNMNLDGVGRFGIVWNNTKWYAGTSAILHTYNYHKSQFHANTTFGNLNIYVGFNFGRK
ncbi:hypothetical protein HMPREF0671_02215 [Prevotella sp. S7 MS 2]|nr:DUF4421 domain-containing protein [Prevotella sp. S7 MS 2]KGI61075.1 hypothetical protein HMPREF0671_02215 [Prevotella sp. S7 MS 2]